MFQSYSGTGPWDTVRFGRTGGLVWPLCPVAGAPSSSVSEPTFRCQRSAGLMSGAPFKLIPDGPGRCVFSPNFLREAEEHQYEDWDTMACDKASQQYYAGTMSHLGVPAEVVGRLVLESNEEIIRAQRLKGNCLESMSLDPGAWGARSATAPHILLHPA
ncbi:hypothetical protein CYMTET_30817, partial [Cymbomonas tetramitiformis]